MQTRIPPRTIALGGILLALLVLLALPEPSHKTAWPLFTEAKGTIWNEDKRGGLTILPELGYEVTQAIWQDDGTLRLELKDHYPTSWRPKQDDTHGCVLVQGNGEPLLSVRKEGTTLILRGLESRSQVYLVR